MSSSVPADFSLHTRSSAVTRPWEPIYFAQDGASIRLGLVIGEAHCNSRGILHGGVIATLADNAMGLTAGLVAGHARQFVTTALSLDYFGVGKIGQWLQITPRAVGGGRRSAVIDAIVSADGVAIARGNASFRGID